MKRIAGEDACQRREDRGRRFGVGVAPDQATRASTIVTAVIARETPSGSQSQAGFRIAAAAAGRGARR